MKKPVKCAIVLGLLLIITYVVSCYICLNVVSVLCLVTEEYPNPPCRFIYFSVDHGWNEAGYYIYWPLVSLYLKIDDDAIFIRDVEYLKGSGWG